MGDDVTATVEKFFVSGCLLKQLNHTTISLIPKKQHDLTVSDFRPISCCNVIYKVITKVLSHRLAQVLPEIINEAQGAFVAGRNI